MALISKEESSRVLICLPCDWLSGSDGTGTDYVMGDWTIIISFRRGCVTTKTSVDHKTNVTESSSELLWVEFHRRADDFGPFNNTTIGDGD
jgi:hypothetical protein